MTHVTPIRQDDDLYRAVREHWIADGLRPAKPDPKGLRSDLRVPADYERFVDVAGLPLREDSKGFLFWQLDDLRRIADVMDVRDPNALDNQAIVFADYLQESWLYALKCAHDTSEVVIVRGAVFPHHRIGSFREFLSWYLQDNDCLYSGPIST